jgi:GTP:adenosylcobinamide-phosphate guanylyltransferase
MIPTILILAGQRDGKPDALAKTQGLSHKAMIKVGGEALIGHVLRAIDAALPESKIIVSIENWPAIAGEPSVARLHKAGRLEHVRSHASLYGSIVSAAADKNFPMLITTADNALLTPEAVLAMVDAGAKHDAAIVGVTRREAIERAHSGGKGRYYEFADGAFSNCNLFWISSRDSLYAAETFKEGGQFLKVKGRLLKTFGLANLLLYRFKVMTIEQMFERVSRRLGCQVVPLVLSDGRLAIDVDDVRSLQMVEDIMAGTPQSPEAVNEVRRRVTRTGG